MTTNFRPQKWSRENSPVDPLSAAADKRDQNVIGMVESALRQKRAMLAFQPVVTAQDTNRISFYEGLIRIADETGRIIPARDFITSVEDNEIGREIDCLTLELGLKAIAADPALRLSINMSARSVGYKRWRRILQRGIRRNPGAVERLILELTEQSVMLMPELVGSLMTDLQRHGIGFALDNFGSGVTSLKHLRDLYFDVVKIDGQFVRGVAHNVDNQVFLAAVLSLSRHFDMFTVAENVETLEEVQFLTSLGVDCLQGYFFGAPTITKPEKLRELVQKRA